MKSFKSLPILLASLCTTALITPGPQAQERGPGPGGEQRQRGEREGGFGRMNPIVAALDTNGDGIIDEKELANATASLKKLDKNGDGKLTEDEYRPQGMRGRGPGGPGGANPEELVTRLMQFDKNGDGKLSKEELPERMQGMLERGDLDKDGFLSKDEIRKMAEAEAGAQGGRRQRGEGGRPEERDGRRPEPRN